MIKRFIHILLVIFIGFVVLSCSKAGKDGINPPGGNESQEPSDGSNTESGGNQSSEEGSEISGEDGKTVQIEKALMIDPESVKAKIADETIMDELNYYINNTPPGESIHISIYLFSYTPTMDALKEAFNRGVEIHLIIDSGRVDSRSNNVNTFPIFRDLLTSPSEMVVVDNDNSAAAINHEKYVLFSKVKLPFGTAKNLVFATSHNFIPSAMKKIQDAIVMSNEGLYQAFLDNWEEVKSRSRKNMKEFEYNPISVGDSLRAVFFPRRTQGAWDGKDDIVEVLSTLDEGTYDQDTVRVFMAFFSRAGIADKLAELQNSGVTVQVITRNNADVSNAVKSRLREIHDEGGYVKNLDISQQNLHSKCMLIKGTINGQKKELILTGSHNYTKGALEYNNEFFIELTDSKLFSKYWTYFNTMQNVLDDFSGWGD